MLVRCFVSILYLESCILPGRIIRVSFKQPRTFDHILSKSILAVNFVFLLTMAGYSFAQSNQSAFPRQMAWTAYNLGSTGYNQAVAIGAMLREKFGVTLRVIPGQNDVSRLLP